MIQLFEVKRKIKKLKREDKELIEKYSEISINTREEILREYNTSESGISDEEAEKIFTENGPNVVVKNEKKSKLYFLFNSFKDKFILILIVLAIVNYFLSDAISTYIILGIAVISALIRYFQDYSVYKFNQELKSKMYTTTHILRNGKEEEIRVEKVVPGDIVKLSAGAMIPADLILIDSKDLFVNQSVFTGERVPVEKIAQNGNGAKEIFSISNICLMGSSVISGSATGVVINTGFNTYLGRMSKEVENKKETTNFEQGMNNITKMLIKYMVIVSIAVFVIYGFIRKDWIEAILFALSVAVGITPSMLPMIVNVNLTRGTKVLAKKKTLVKNINSIQNLGAIDMLCTDKTGTLTEDKIVLQKYIDVNGNEDISILEYAYLNSYFGTGMMTLVDRAIINYGNEKNMLCIVYEYKKIDEIPFDYTRKRMSVVVCNSKNNGYRMLTKGALEEILKVCDKVKYNGQIKILTPALIEEVEQKAKEYAVQGMQVIALASKREYRGINVFNVSDEKDMTFIGFVAFLDPAKKDVKETLSKLKKIGITTKILTGDNPYATGNICKLVGIDNSKILL